MTEIERAEMLEQIRFLRGSKFPSTNILFDILEHLVREFPVIKEHKAKEQPHAKSKRRR